MRFNRHVVAALLAIAGISAAAFSIWRANRIPIPSRVPPLPISSLLLPDAALGPNVIDTIPTANNVTTVLDDIRSNTKSKIEALPSLGFSQIQCFDLIAAFIERLGAIIAPDFDRDFRAAKLRGLTLSEQVAHESYKESKELFEWFKLSPLGVKRIDYVVRRGPRGQTSEKLNGYVVLESSVREQWPYPVPIDSCRIELILPMSARTIPKISEDEREIVLLGATFHWSSSRNQWIPGALKTYSRLSVNGPPKNKLTSVPSTF